MRADSTSGASRGARPTMRDIADLAGTSVMTVSRALNGKPGVSDATTRRIRAIAEEVGFRPNDLARGLRGGVRSDTVGLVLEQATTRLYRRLITGVQAVAGRHGALVLTASSGSPEREEASVLALSRSRVDGLLVVLSGPDQSFLIPEQVAGVPMVFVDREPRGIAADFVGADDRGGAREATRHLLARGHRRIGVIGGRTSTDTVLRRLDGHHAALDAAGIPRRANLVRLDCIDIDDAYRAAADLVGAAPAPTALLTLKVDSTLGALRAVRDAGRQDRIALVGFDDFETADLLDPPVSVVHHDIEQVGLRAAEILFSRIGGDDSAIHDVRLPTWLVPRGSGELPGPHDPIRLTAQSGP